MQQPQEPRDPREMTAETIGVDLLGALVQEIKLLPDPWAKLSQAKQDDVIGRLRARVETNVKMAVHLIASEGRTVVAGDLDQITIKDGVKAVVKFSQAAPNLHELYDAASKAVLVVVANPADHTGGMDQVKGESDQRAMNLGKEYTDKDGDGMDDDNVVDAEFKVLPAPDEPTEEELKSSWDAGHAAAESGQPQSACPVVASALVIEWIRGWKTWYDENGPVATAKLGELPNEHGVYSTEPDLIIEWENKKHSLMIELLELENGLVLYALTKNHIAGEFSSGPLSINMNAAASRVGALEAIKAQLVELYNRGADAIGIKGKAYMEFCEFVDGLVENYAEPTEAEE